MKKCEIKELINEAAEHRKFCKLLLYYEENSYFVFPLITGEKLFLCANEDDFILNGYSIRRFRDVLFAENQEGKIFEMINAEGLLGGLTVPDVDVTNWGAVFNSLQKMNKNIIVGNECASDGELAFVIGKIEKITKTKVLMRHFDADGIWEDELYEIPFSKITSVSFSTRYVDIFSKYV